MGVTGLTTFLSNCGEKYNTQIYLHHHLLIVDGCNLMYYLYLRGPILKYNAHLFGGDCPAFCSAVRDFFQKLKQADIVPLVVFDGAYESGKIKTVIKRYGKQLKDNVQNKVSGKSYTTVLIKVAFLEILRELKIDCYQTEFEADDTIAYIAKKLNCPVLSSDSDFFIHSNLTTIPLGNIDFRKVKLKKKKSSSTNKQADKDEQEDQKIKQQQQEHKQFCLVGKSIKLYEMYKKEFKIVDPRLLSLLPVVIGNDQITSRIFAKFHHQKGGAKVKRNSRITYLLQWFGRQPSFEIALEKMLQTTKEGDRERIKEKVLQVVSNYMGDGGEDFLWNVVRNSQTVLNYIKNTDNQNVDSFSNPCKSEDITTSAENVTSLCDLIDDLTINDNSNNNDDLPGSDNDEDDEDDDDNIDTSSITSVIESSTVPKLPEWYMLSHSKCELLTYLIKLYYNRSIFLTPQVEISSLPSTHAVCIPIIQITAGILCGKCNITLVTREKTNIRNVIVETVTSLPKYGTLPTVNNESNDDFRVSLSCEKRLSILLEALQLSRFTDFLLEWPPFMRFWIVTCLYFLKKLKKVRGFYIAVGACLAVILSVLKKDYPFPTKVNNQPTKEGTDSSEINNKQSVSTLLTLQLKDTKLTAFFQQYSSGVEGGLVRNFWKSYDINRVYIFSQYNAVIFHTFMLNNLLGNPVKQPKLTGLNCHIVYNVCTNLADKNFENIGTFLDKEFETKSPLKVALTKFVEIVNKL